MKIVNNIPAIMAKNLCKLKLWFSELSNKIIVDICKNTQIITAVISEL